MNEFYVGQQSERDTLGYDNDNGGYWIYLLGSTITLFTSVDKIPVWKESYDTNERRDEINALIAYKSLCRALVNTSLSLRTLLDMHCRNPYHKPAITDAEWPEFAAEHDAARVERLAR